MCGIVGVMQDREKIDENIVLAMRETLHSRGPDDAGIYLEDHLAFAHRRLSIIDLSAGAHQPMRSDNGRLILTYNGEIYNFIEVRKELEKLGHRFKTSSDTEVLLKSFEQWGLDCVHRFRGMWAFAIWDREKEELLLCRDRVGVKPLYWYHRDGLFMFASELKALHKHPLFKKDIDAKGLALYFQLGYIPAPYTIFSHVKKVKPGHFILLRKGGQTQEIKYWDIDSFYLSGFPSRERQRGENTDPAAMEQQLEALLVESFKLRLVADVPVGMFLSGGIDSSTVATLLQINMTRRLKTFTIGFVGSKTYDEAPFAKKISDFLGTDHTEHYFKPNEITDILPNIPLLYDEPFGDSSALPTYLVSTIAAKQVKVSLSADGGDELFCGYGYYASSAVKGVDFLISLSSKMRINNCLLGVLKTEAVESWLFSGHPSIPKLKSIRGKVNRLSLLLNQTRSDKRWDIRSALMYLDFVRYLPDDILVKVDRATMGVSLEGREPFLDSKLVEFVARLPIEDKFRNGVSKYILRKIVYKHLPPELLERPKQGFSIPLDEGEYRLKLKDLFCAYLDDGPVRKIGILDPQPVRKILKAWLVGKINYPIPWYVLCFQMWAERYL